MRRLMCLLGRHSYYVVVSYTAYSRQVGCRHCARRWAMSDDARALVPWDADFERFYREWRLVA